MTADTNKAVMLCFVEFINTGNEKLAQELNSLDGIFHVSGVPSQCGVPLATLQLLG